MAQFINFKQGGKALLKVKNVKVGDKGVSYWCEYLKGKDVTFNDNDGVHESPSGDVNLFLNAGNHEYMQKIGVKKGSTVGVKCTGFHEKKPVYSFTPMDGETQTDDKGYIGHKKQRLDYYVAKAKVLELNLNLLVDLPEELTFNPEDVRQWVTSDMIYLQSKYDLYVDKLEPNPEPDGELTYDKKDSQAPDEEPEPIDYDNKDEDNLPF